ncbi:DUF5007 domain-containing protein [Sphingobacterium sp. SRCM116780]|uniref:DUF5007 domain-containing protein n=1 Tax=Sphingobacterium sp. SRCM116780 TaxID=2907623 RepID=UPI001F3D467D|nr:DUF5007 domain-containing protein [Sphingobacterium sp. SRCM116780]UIR56070.1 DUF5007 domain-containing protein [Sphingobacterium sp. SRCM116780]
MKKSLLYTLAIGILAVTACKKLPEGNLSDIIRYEVLPMEIKKGRAEVSTAINPAGSSKPTEYKLLKIYEKETGKDVTDIFQKTYPIKIWTQLYDSKVDKTIEQIDAKRKDTVMVPLAINKLSGAVESNQNTLQLPSGSYLFDLEIKNSAGTKIYPKIGEFKLVDAPFFDIPAVRSTTAMKVGAETTTKSIPSNASHIKVTALDSKENKIIVRIVDKNGVPFNPKAGEVGRRPNAGTAGGFLQTMQDYSLTTTLFDDRMEFTYGVVPFPLVSLGNGFNYYYRIPAKYVKFDDSLGLPYNTYSCNARFSFQAFVGGTYQIDVIVPQVTRVN